MMNVNELKMTLLVWVESSKSWVVVANDISEEDADEIIKNNPNHKYTRTFTLREEA